MVKFIKKLFSYKEPQEAPASKDAPVGESSSVSHEVPTVPFTLDMAQEVAPLNIYGEGSTDTPQLIVGCSQSVGQQRDHNEDALFTLTTNLTKDGNNLSLGLYIVADGMGGHKHGELASEIAVRATSSYILSKILISLISIDPIQPDESLQEIMQSSIHEAHHAIVNEVAGSGTTLTAALIVGGQMTIAHIGDSRAYSISKDGTMLPLTRDHSLVMRMIELGQLSAKEAAVHPQRNVLYRALGQGDPFNADISTSSIPESGHILLCSDGLWGVVSEEDIAQIITTSSNPQQACQFLVDAANTAGGPDNITAILIQLPD